MQKHKDYDYIVVGAGSAGAIVAKLVRIRRLKCCWWNTVVVITVCLFCPPLWVFQ